MLPVTEAFKNVFEENGFECEVAESEKEDQVRIPMTGETFGPRLLVVRFLHDSDLVAVVLPDLVEIPKGKSSIAINLANELHRSSHLVKLWVDKKNRSLWAMANTLALEPHTVDISVNAVSLLMDYCTRMYPVIQSALEA